jgi:ligand-binding sensor domain-containing protein/serine phosphatase RsbU (regulator of sigma subunit)
MNMKIESSNNLAFIKRIPLLLFFLLILILTLLSGMVSAQSFNFQRPEFNDWIPEKIYCATQDKKGYYWLGSPDGLTRIDGTTAKNFGISDGLAPAGVRSILEDSQGDIWFGHNNGGISRFNGRTFEQVAFDSISITGDVTSIVETIEGGIWFTTTNEGAIFAELPIKDIKHIKARQFKGKERLSNMVFGSTLTKTWDLICITDVGLRRFIKSENRFDKFQLPGMATYSSTTCILEDSNGNIWFGTYNGGIFKYIISQSKMEVIDLLKAGLSSNWISCLTEDSKGRIWIGTFGGGIALIDGTHMRKFDSSNGLKASRIYDIIEDVECNILIVDQNNGLTIFKGDEFIAINEKEILPGSNVNAISQDEAGSIWFGTNAGVSHYFPGSEKNPSIYDKANNSIYEDIRFLKKDREGNLWIGTNSGGVIVYNLRTSKFEAQPNINSTLPRTGQITAMEIDKLNNLWIGTVEGVVIGTIYKQNFQRYNVLDSLTVFGITALYCDPKGNMWIGTEARGANPTLIRYDNVKKHFKLVSAFTGIKPTAISMDENGVLLIGTDNDGIFFLKDGELVKPFYLPEIIRSSRVSCIELNKNNDIFVGTRVGLYIYNTRNERLLYLSKKEGLCDNNISSISFDNNGYAWIGTRNGVSRIPTDINLYLKPPPRPILKNIEINSRQINTDSLSMLKHYQNNLSFTLGYSGFSDPSTISYHAKLEGLDREWVDYAHSSKIGFPPLTPGNYTLNVITVNTLGSSSKEILIIPFRILPPWWKTRIAYTSYLIVLILSVFLFNKYRERKLIREKIALEKIVKERTIEIEKQKEEIEIKRDLVIKQKEHIEEIHKEVTDSINYAKRIQTSALPDKNLLSDYFSETFIIFKPKDIVSGDFYWFVKVENQIIITVADCTGHGVPGAFMSMLGMSLLKEIVVKEYITQPDVILRRLRKAIIKALGQTGASGEQKDGMDISLCSINSETHEMQWSGANIPCLIMKNGVLTKLEPNKMPIAIFDVMNKFTLHKIKLQKNDIIYLASDGFSDQFGGPNNKKFMSNRFRDILLTISGKPMSKQEEILYKTLEEWENCNDKKSEQTDDITVMGLRIS